jgi:curved DNA-binding protein CbpA
MPDLKTCYAILELPENASRESVKKAYRRLSKKYHPDLNADQDANLKFIKINEAYRLITEGGSREKEIQFDRFSEERRQSKEDLRRKAWEYVRKQEAERRKEIQDELNRLYRWFNYIAGLFFLLNLVFLLDLFLPVDKLKDELIGYERIGYSSKEGDGQDLEVYQKDLIVGKEYSFFTYKNQGGRLTGDSLYLEVTPIFSKVLQVTAETSQKEKIQIKVLMNYYRSLRYFAPVAWVLILLYFFISYSNQNKLTIAILIFFLMMGEALIFFQ